MCLVYSGQWYAAKVKTVIFAEYHMRAYNQISGKNVQRIEALSDGVFAIALTLLVLDVRVPIREHIVYEKDLVVEFSRLTPKLLTYLLSFMTLGIFWTAHSSQFHYIEKSDRNFNWLNLSFLLFVTVIPFTTAFLSEFISFRFAVAVYWLNLFLLGIMLRRILNYAYKHNYFKSDMHEKAEIRKALVRRGNSAQSLYAIGALLCFISTYLSIAVLIIIQLYFVLAFPKSQSGVVPKNRRATLLQNSLKRVIFLRDGHLAGELNGNLNQNKKNAINQAAKYCLHS